MLHVVRSCRRDTCCRYIPETLQRLVICSWLDVAVDAEHLGGHVSPHVDSLTLSPCSLNYSSVADVGITCI